MTFLKYFILVTMVPFIVDMLNEKKESKDYTKSLDKFTIRTGNTIVYFGVIWFVIITVILVGLIYHGQVFPAAEIGIFILFYSMALICFLYPAPRFWDIVVDEDNITVIKFFVFTKKTTFSEIAKVEIANNNYLRIYINGRNRAFFLIDPMMNGKNNFLKRIEMGNIPLIDMHDCR